mmetsp:Transcript_117801/g.367055  ORF Transcript_117801/g.367055 Transcript_117801/m.367055 type:complete len:355 (-) Transcript_117801:391-1455(-)
MGMPTEEAFLAEETARSGWAVLDIQAMVSGGSTVVSGELRWPSTRTRRCSSKTQPSRMRSLTVTGSGVVEVSLRSGGSKDATRCRLSMDTESFRAVCCRRAFRKTSARRKSLRTTACSTGFLDAARFSQSPFRAASRFERPVRKTVGSSGAEGQPDVQEGGTSPRMRLLASAWMSGVLRTWPLMTFCSVTRDAETLLSSLTAYMVSMSTKAMMGGSSGDTALTSTFLSLDSSFFDTFSQRVHSGLSCCFHALMSTLPELPSPAPPELAVASCRSMPMARWELMRCRDLSAFGAMPKEWGLSKSGSCSTRARKSDMLVEAGMSNGGISTPPFFRGPSRMSFLKKRERYSRTSRES